MTDGCRPQKSASEATAFLVEKGENIRLDVYLAAETEYSRSHIKTLVDAGKVLVNGCKSKCGRILKENDIIEARLERDISFSPIPAEIPLDVLYEDDLLIVINKQQGLTVHPAAGNRTETLVNALLWRGTALSSGGDPSRPGIVHRLDKDTSGVMVVAKTDAAHAELARQFAGRTVVKIYKALLEGNLKADRDILTTFIARDPKDRKRMTVAGEGRVAITEYRLLRRFKDYCFVEFTLHTGRTHQIRVHARYLSHPVVGDKTYGYAGKRFTSLAGQLLHSCSLTFTHPTSGERMTFTAPLPDYFQKVYDTLVKEEKN